MKIILNLLSPYKKQLSVSLTMKSVAALADLFLPWIIAYMIDVLIPNLKLEIKINDKTIQNYNAIC